MHESLYQAHLLDHSQRPRNFGPLEGATWSRKGSNPSCGDELLLHLKIVDGVIEQVSFEGSGCAVSTAAASMLTEAIKGKTIDEARLFDDRALYDLLKVEIHAGREKCALLALRTLHEALAGAV